jgi:hypothetical protein
MAAQLAARHVFGLKGDVKANFAYHDDQASTSHLLLSAALILENVLSFCLPLVQTIVFVAGHTTVVHNLETRTQRFLHGAEKADEITALAMSSNRCAVLGSVRAVCRRLSSLHAGASLPWPRKPRRRQ